MFVSSKLVNEKHLLVVKDFKSIAVPVLVTDKGDLVGGSVWMGSLLLKRNTLREAQGSNYSSHRKLLVLGPINIQYFHIRVCEKKFATETALSNVQAIFYSP